jgi:hypothetical protein
MSCRLVASVSRHLIRADGILRPETQAVPRNPIGVRNSRGTDRGSVRACDLERDARTRSGRGARHDVRRQLYRLVPRITRLICGCPNGERRNHDEVRRGGGRLRRISTAGCGRGYGIRPVDRRRRRRDLKRRRGACAWSDRQQRRGKNDDRRTLLSALFQF